MGDDDRKVKDSDNIIKLLRLPDLFSVINALSGFSAILFAFSASFPPDINIKYLESAIVFILFAAIIDGIDGFIARSFESSPLGIYLDSFADMLSFGIAPAIVIYVLLMEEFYYISSAVCGAYVVSGMLRLARFTREKELFGKDEDFKGLPITGSAVYLASSTLFFIHLHLPFPLLSSLITVFTIILCVLMTSRIRYRNIRDKRIAIPVSIIFISFFLFYLLSLPLLFHSLLLFALSSIYICSPIKMEG
ncbi:MAG: CDP-alcohol phosphatidyltransferase family protein [Candidatus Methanospirareceae archaeon]